MKAKVIRSSGNVFEDLGLKNPEELLIKAKLAMQINEIIRQKRLTQKDAAVLLDIDQPKISLLARGRLSGFSLERLFKFLNVLGRDVSIRIKVKPRSRALGNISVSAGTSRTLSSVLTHSNPSRRPTGSSGRAG